MTNTIQLYDATLRDGMQGEGMSLSAEEKLRVAHRLDELGIELIEAGFPASNPKERELFELLAGERFRQAQIAAFGMTRRRELTADADPALIALAESVAPVCTLVGKTWTLHLEIVVKVDREENLRMIAESIAFLRGTGKRVIYDAEHFFDGYRADPDYALRCIRAAAEAGAETVTLCDTNGSSLPSQVAAATAQAVSEVGDAVRIGIHCHNDAECAVANTLAAVEVGARQVQGTMNGCGERTGNANLISIIANLQLKMGHRVLSDEQLARLTETAHFVDEILNVTPDPNQPYVGRNAFAHKGGMHVAGVAADASTFEHIDPALVGNERELLVSELAGRASMIEKAAELGIELDDATATRVIGRVKQLEHEGYQFEAADGSLELLLRRETGGLRAALHARVLARDRRAARRRRGADRGDDQDLDGRRAPRADRRGQRPGQRARPRAARRDRRGPPAPGGHRARQLQGPHPRREQGHRRGHARAARRLRRRRACGARSGSPRTSSRRRGWRSSTRSSAACSAVRPRERRRAQDEVPLAQPVLGEAEEDAVSRVLRSGRLSLGPLLGAFERRFAAFVGAPLASAVSSGTAGLHLALRAVGVRDGDEVITSPFSFVASANAIVYERARPVFVDIDPRTLTIDPAAAAAAVTSARARCCRCTSSAGPPTCRRSSASGLPIVEDACEALGARFADGVAVGARGHPAVFGFYANKQMTTGEGGMVTLARRGAQGAHRQRAKPGPRARHGLARPRPARLQLPPQRARSARSGSRSSTASRGCSRRARASPRAYGEALAGIEGLELLCPDEQGGAVRGWFVYMVGLPRGIDRDATIRALRERGIQSKPYLPAIHLMSYYRETFGHRAGRVPGLRGRRRALARAAVLPRALDEGADRARRGRARRRARPAALDVDWRRRCRASPSRRTPTSRRSTPRSRSTAGCGPTTSRSRARTRACSRRSA